MLQFIIIMHLQAGFLVCPPSAKRTSKIQSTIPELSKAIPHCLNWLSESTSTFTTALGLRRAYAAQVAPISAKSLLTWSTSSLNKSLRALFNACAGRFRFNSRSIVWRRTPVGALKHRLIMLLTRGDEARALGERPSEACKLKQISECLKLHRARSQ